MRELILTAARTVLAHHDAGRVVDPYALKWACTVLAINAPAPTTQPEEVPA